MRTLTADEVCAMVARNCWGKEHGATSKCPDRRLPTQEQLANDFPKPSSGARREADRRLTELYGHPAQWAYYLSPEQGILLTAFVEDPDRANAYHETMESLIRVTHMEEVHADWFNLHGSAPYHPLEPLVADWQGFPLELERSRKGYTRVEKIVLFDRSLSANAKLLYTTLCAHCFHDRTMCYPGTRRLMELTGLSQSSIKRARAELRNAGYIELTQVRQETIRYNLCLRVHKIQVGSTRSQVGSHRTHPGGSEGTPENNKGIKEKEGGSSRRGGKKRALELRRKIGAPMPSEAETRS